MNCCFLILNCEYGEYYESINFICYLYIVKRLILPNKYFLFLLLAFYLICVKAYSQKNNDNIETFRIVFYNLENYFDVYVDSTLSYNEFSPMGDLHWTNKKFQEKTKNLYKVFQAISGWKGIVLAGVCEIENKFVLNQLLYNMPLNSREYRYIHYDSHDKRGIDVALIYGKQFKPLHSQVYSILDDHGEEIETRDILYVKGMLTDDTVHVFVNHWTSRYRGLLESSSLRWQFSKLLKSKTDSIQDLIPDAYIIIMGDFNDQPHDKSVKNLTNDSRLHNMVSKAIENNSPGTVKFRSDWYIFDQILVSSSLKNKKNNLSISDDGLMIFDKLFLLEKDVKHLGYKPYRTNLGYKYHGGYSDHLPIYFDLISN